MAKIITMGEIMLRLSPPGYERFAQATSFDVVYGGAEGNVAASLAQFGHDVSFVTKVPNNEIGKCAVKSLLSLGVDCSHIAYGGERLGIYYLENGASVRPSSVVYDRAGSSFATSRMSDYDFEAAFEGVDLFHVSGITPVLSPELAQITLEAVKAAKEAGVTVSFDLNYRSKLWTSDIEQKQEMMSKIIAYADICFGNPRDAAKCMGYSVPELDLIECEYADVISESQMKKMLDAFNLKCIITTLRESISASDNGWSARVCTADGVYTGAKYSLHIVDRVGGGDSFAAGCLHGLVSEMPPEDSLEFGIAAAAIKHTIKGDVNFTNVAEVQALIESKGSARVQR